MNRKTEHEKEMDVLREKLVKGTRMAVKKLIEERKKENGYLIVSKTAR